MSKDTKSRYEFWFYVSVGAGLANATSSFMIMSGLFEVVQGLWVALAVIGSGVLCWVTASAIAEQASLFPGSSGLRTYLKHSLGNQMSLFLVYIYLAFIVLGAGIESRLFAYVFTSVFPHFPPIAVSIVLFGVILGINLLGIEVPRIAQIVCLFLVLAGIAMFGLAGIFSLPHPQSLLHASFNAGWKNLFYLPVAIGMGFFLFVGFEWVTPLGFRPQSYQRVVPYSMFAAIAVTGLVAVLFVIGMAAQFQQEAIVKTPLPQIELAVALFGAKGRIAALVLCTLATLSTFNAGLLGGARLIYALAREKNFFKVCTKVSLRTGVTYGSILLLGFACLASSLLVLEFGFEMSAAVIGSAIVCCVYGSLVYSMIRLRVLKTRQQRAYISPVPLWLNWILVPVLPLLGLASLLITPEVGAGAWIGFGLCALVSYCMTLWFTSRKEKSVSVLAGSN